MILLKPIFLSYYLAGYFFV